MNIVSVIVATCIVLVGIAYRQSVKTNLQISSNENETTVSVSPILITQTPFPSHTPTISPQETKPLVQITESLTPTMKKMTHYQSNWKYPNAIIISNSDSNVELRSFDAAKTITSWYETELIKYDYKARSIVKTNTNGKSNNVLVAAKIDSEIRIEIKQEKENEQTSITVTIK